MSDDIAENIRSIIVEAITKSNEIATIHEKSGGDTDELKLIFGPICVLMFLDAALTKPVSEEVLTRMVNLTRILSSQELQKGENSNG